MNKNNINDRHMHIVRCLEMLPRVLARFISLYDYEIKGESQILTKGYDINWVSSFADKNDNQLVFCEGNNMHIFDLKSNKIVETLTDYYNYPSFETGSFQKFVAYYGMQGAIVVWNINAKKSEHLAYDLEEINQNCFVNVISFEDKIISGSFDGHIKIWNVSVEAEGLTRRELKYEDTIYFDDKLISFDVLFDGRIICASSKKIKIWNIGKKQFELEIEHLFIEKVVAVDKLIVISQSYEKSLIIYDSITGKKISTIPLCWYGTQPLCVATLPNGNVVCGYSSWIKIFDPYTGTCQHDFCAGKCEFISLIKVINDGKIISCSSNGLNGNYVARIWS